MLNRAKATSHTHQVVFGRRIDGCPRCAELASGQPARRWNTNRGVWTTSRIELSAARLAEIRSHDCVTSRCGPVCTHGDY